MTDWEEEVAQPQTFDSCDHSLFLQKLFNSEIGPDSLYLAVRPHVAVLHTGVRVSKLYSSVVLL